MGAGNVKLAFALWGDLPHAAFRGLAYMALVSKDDDRPPRYWGGREDLAAGAFGRKIPERNDDDPAVVKERRAAFRAVDRVIADLTKAGAIEPIEAARNYRRTTYALRLDRRSTTENVVLQDHVHRGSQDHGERGSQDHVHRGVQDHAHRGALRRKSEGGLGLTSGETGRGDLPPEPGAHAQDREPLKSVPTHGVRDPLPAAAGIPGQRAMLLPVATASSRASEVLEDQDVDEVAAVPYGRCTGCLRPFARPPKNACPNCGLMIQTGAVS